MTAALKLPDANPGRLNGCRRREAFLKWQCRVRQIAMRSAGGRPDAAMRPVALMPDGRRLGPVTTLLLKSARHDVTPELRHMAQRTHDPAERRAAAVRFFSASHYQRAREFSCTLAAVFPPGALWARMLLDAGRCRLRFDAYSQEFDLDCAVIAHGCGDRLREAAFWHNLLFNPNLHPDAVVLGFSPDWDRSTARPDLA